MTAATHAPEHAASWHNLETADVLKQLTTPETGLSVEEARRRLEINGPNELQAFERSSAWHTLAAHFKNVLVVILLVATVLSGLLGHGLEAAIIAVIVLFAVLERPSRATPPGHAIRGGIEAVVPARELVVGDLIVLRAGDPLEPVDGIRQHRNQIDHYLHEVVLVRASVVAHLVEQREELVGANTSSDAESLRLWVRLGQWLGRWLDTAAGQ